MAVTPVDGLAAGNTLLQIPSVTPGYCLHYVWQSYKYWGARSEGSYATATDAWYGSAGQHPGDRNPPPGVPVYWGPKASSAAGDVVISLGGGQVAATDWPYNGVTGQTSLDARQQQIGRPYLGWTETILNFPIALEGAPDMTEDESKALFTILQLLNETEQWQGVVPTLETVHTETETIRQVLMETVQWVGMDARLTAVQDQVNRLEPLLDLLDTYGKRGRPSGSD